MSAGGASRAVKVVRGRREIVALSDPIKQESLRLLIGRPRTQSQLARELNMPPSSMSYHLRELQELEMVRIQRTEVERHGIVEKYYEATADCFVEDFRSIPKKYVKYFLRSHIERLRGALAILYILKRERGERLVISPERVEELARETAERVSFLGEEYEREGASSEGEELIIELYGKAMEDLFKKV